MRKDIDDSNLGFLLGKIKSLFAKASNSTPIATNSVISLNESMNLDVPLYVHFLQMPTPLVIGNATSLINPKFGKAGSLTIIFSANGWTALNGFLFSLSTGNQIGSHIANTLTTPALRNYDNDYKITISWSAVSGSAYKYPSAITATYQTRYAGQAWSTWS